MAKVPITPTVSEYTLFAVEAWSICQGATGAQLEEEWGIRHVTGQTLGLLEYAVDVRRLVELCDRSGYLSAVLLEGLRMEAVPDSMRERLHTDLGSFRREMVKGGYRVEE